MLAPGPPAGYASGVSREIENPSSLRECISGPCWATDGSCFSPRPPQTGICLDLATGELMLGLRPLPLPSMAVPEGLSAPSRFFSTAQSRLEPGSRWSGSDPLSTSRMFNSAGRMAPEVCARLSAAAALDMVSFIWQSKVMMATAKSRLAAGWLHESPSVGGTGVRMSAFLPASSEPSIFAAARPKVSPVFSPPSAFLAPPRPHSTGKVMVDEVSGMVSDASGRTLALGLPKNPRGARVSHLGSRSWPGVDPMALPLVEEHRRPGAIPTILSHSPEEALTVLAESWLWLSSRFSPRGQASVKIRCDFSLGRHWCILESPGTLVSRQSGKEESRHARRAEEAKMRAAVLHLSGTQQCSAMEAFARPEKFPTRRMQPSRTADRRPSPPHR